MTDASAPTRRSVLSAGEAHEEPFWHDNLASEICYVEDWRISGVTSSEGEGSGTRLLFIGVASTFATLGRDELIGICSAFFRPATMGNLGCAMPECLATVWLLLDIHNRSAQCCSQRLGRPETIIIVHERCSGQCFSSSKALPTPDKTMDHFAKKH